MRRDCADIGVVATRHHANVAMRQAKMDRDSDVIRTLFFGPHADMPTVPLTRYEPVPYRRKRMLRLGAVKVDAPRFHLVIRHCDERCAADHADWADDALADGAEHSGFWNVQETAQFACAHECPLVAGAW